MKKIIAVIDIDNTIADTQNSIRQFLEEKGVNPARLHAYSNEFRDDLDEDYSGYIAEYIYSENYEETVFRIPLFPGSLEALETLSKICDIYVVSSRINNWHNPTHEWLKSQQINNFIKGCFLRDKSEASLAFKMRVIEKLDADIVFEDSLEVVRSLSDTTRSYLIDQTWNRDVRVTDRYMRFNSFSDSVSAFIES